MLLTWLCLVAAAVLTAEQRDFSYQCTDVVKDLVVDSDDLMVTLGRAHYDVITGSEQVTRGQMMMVDRSPQYAKLVVVILQVTEP